MIEEILTKSEKKILLIVLDGLGGLPINGKTELESAHIPNLSSLARKSSLGLSIPIDYGITPGSGSAHLALFGYDPLVYQIGRGVMEALGVGLEVKEDDLCIRANFATVREGIVLDRRADRLKGYEISPDEKNFQLCRRLQLAIKELEGVEVTFKSGKEHRFVIRLRGENLSPNVTENDPGRDNLSIPEIGAKEEGGKFTAYILNLLVNKAEEVLKGEDKANWILLRGYAKRPLLPPFPSTYNLKAAGIALYPMYKGIAQLVGMEVLPCEENWEGEIKTLLARKRDFDFFYLHFKEIDSKGEDGDFDGKVELIEKFDDLLPTILKMDFDCLAITSDHSTPALLKSHSWHPCPFLLFSPYARADGIGEFTEKGCARGSLGIFPAVKVMPLLFAHTLRLKKFGA